MPGEYRPVKPIKAQQAPVPLGKDAVWGTEDAAFQT